MSEQENNTAELKIVTEILSALSTLDQEGRQRVLQTVGTFYRVAHSGTPTPNLEVRGVGGPQATFSEDRSMTPKEFLVQKLPKTDTERVTCLAYYLTHYRHTPHFKTLDISQLNTEAAQPKFSNAAYSVDNATKLGYLVPALKGTRQLSAAGELFVNALPNREAARAAMASARPRRRNKKRSQDGGEDVNQPGDGNEG